MFLEVLLTVKTKSLQFPLQYNESFRLHAQTVNMILPQGKHDLVPLDRQVCTAVAHASRHPFYATDCQVFE